MVRLVEEKRVEIGELCRMYGVERLDLFGSATGTGFDQRTSDVDFVVIFAPNILDNRFKRYFGFLIALEELLGRKVDLVEYRAITNPYFMAEVDQSRIPLYAA